MGMLSILEKGQFFAGIVLLLLGKRFRFFQLSCLAPCSQFCYNMGMTQVKSEGKEEPMKTKTENKKKRFFGRLTAIMLALVAIGSCALTASAATISAWPRGDASDRVHTHYENIPVMVSASEKEVSDCYLIDETTYAPLRSLCEAVCGWTSISFDAKTRTGSDARSLPVCLI